MILEEPVRWADWLQEGVLVASTITLYQNKRVCSLKKLYRPSRPVIFKALGGVALYQEKR